MNRLRLFKIRQKESTSSVKSSKKLNNAEQNIQYAFFDEKTNRVFKKSFSYAKPFFNGFALVQDNNKIDFINQQGKCYFKEYCAQHDSVKYADLQMIFSFNETPFIILEPSENDSKTRRFIPGGSIPFYRWCRMQGGFLIQINLISFFEKIKSELTNNEINSDNLVRWFSDRKMDLYIPEYYEEDYHSFDELLTSKILPKTSLDKPLSYSEEYCRGYFYIEASDYGSIYLYGPYEDVKYSESVNYTPIKLFGKKYGYSNLTPFDHFTIEPIFDDAFSFSEGLAKVRFNNKYGFINLFGEYFIKPKYADARSFKNGLAVVAKFHNRIEEKDLEDDYVFLEKRYEEVKCYNEIDLHSCDFTGFEYAIIDFKENVVQKSFFGRPLIYISFIRYFMLYIAVDVNRNKYLENYFKCFKYENGLPIINTFINQDKEIYKDKFFREFIGCECYESELCSCVNCPTKSHCFENKVVSFENHLDGISKLVEFNCSQQFPSFNLEKKNMELDGKHVFIEELDEIEIQNYDIDPCRIDVLNEYYSAYAASEREYERSAGEEYYKQKEKDDNWERCIKGEIDSWGDDWNWNVD